MTKNQGAMIRRELDRHDKGRGKRYPSELRERASATVASNGWRAGATRRCRRSSGFPSRRCAGGAWPCPTPGGPPRSFRWRSSLGRSHRSTSSRRPAFGLEKRPAGLVRLARGIQVLRRLGRGVVWEPGQLSIVELQTMEAVVEQIAYAIVNPVKAGLVHRAIDWPGVTAQATDLGRRVLTARRPDFYFSPKNEKWVAEASLMLTLPECLRELGEERAHALLAAEIERQGEEARAYVKDKRWTVLGAKAATKVSPYRRATSWEEFGKLAPSIAAGRGQTEARVAAIKELQEFRAAHAEAKARWCRGERDVVFPAGTYWMRVHHQARVAPFA
jgi:putative transposase